jgi:hypothetical protein
MAPSCHNQIPKGLVGCLVHPVCMYPGMQSHGSHAQEIHWTIVWLLVSSHPAPLQLVFGCKDARSYASNRCMQNVWLHESKLLLTPLCMQWWGYHLHVQVWHITFFVTHVTPFSNPYYINLQARTTMISACTNITAPCTIFIYIFACIGTIIGLQISYKFFPFPSWSCPRTHQSSDWQELHTMTWLCKRH